MSIDAIAKIEGVYYFACFVARSRSSQTHLGDYSYIKTTFEEAKAVAAVRGFSGDTFLFNGHAMRRLGVAS